MKILYATPFVPYPPNEGALLVSYSLVRGLAERGHALTLLVAARRAGDEANLAALAASLAPALRVRGVASGRKPPARFAAEALARGLSLRIERHRLPAVAAELERTLREDAEPDVVFLDTVFTAYLLPLVRRLAPRTPAVLLELNVESQVFRRFAASRKSLAWRALSAVELPRIEAAERAAHAAADRVLTLSEEDARTIRAGTPGAATFVLGAGIPTYEGASIAPPPDPKLVLFLASYRWPPNADAAAWLARAIWPLVRGRDAGARLVLAGRDPNGSAARWASAPLGIEAAGFVEDAVKVTRGAALCVAPILAGGGVRIKILEALANERPVVTTALGAEGLGLIPGTHALFADDAESFAAAIGRLLRSPEEARRLAAAGRRFVEARFAWPRVIDRLEALLGEVAAARRGASA